MEEKKQKIIDSLVEDRVKILETNKEKLEEQITKDTAGEQKLPEPFTELQKEKLADTIKEIKILKTETIKIENNETEQESDSQD